MLPPYALVVVADGHSARLFRNEAQHGVHLSEIERVSPDSLNRLPHCGNAARVAWGRDEALTFAAQLADYLNAMVLRHKVDDVVVIADAPTLSVLRKRYHKELQFRLHREIDRNLTDLAPGAIEGAIEDALA